MRNDSAIKGTKYRYMLRQGCKDAPQNHEPKQPGTEDHVLSDSTNMRDGN